MWSDVVGAVSMNTETVSNGLADEMENDTSEELLIVTQNAADKVKALIEEEGNDALKLRVFVTGGGCSGFQYGFSFDENVNDGDTAIEKDGVTFLVDSMSYQYLIGAELDYQEGLMGAQFMINNPNASTTCGCGSSFSV